MKRSWLKWLRGVLALALTGIVIWLFDWRTLLANFRIDPWIVLAGVLPLVMINFAIRGWRYQSLMAIQGQPVPFYRAYVTAVTFIGLGTLTPFQAAEALRVETQDRTTGHGRAIGYGLFLLERMLDFTLLLAFAGIALLTMTSNGRALPAGFAWAAGIALVALFFCALAAYLWFKPARRLGLALLMVLRATQPQMLAKLGLATLASWLVTAGAWWLSLRAGGLDVPFFTGFACMAVVTPVNILSMIPGSIGVSELTTATFLSISGLSPVQAQTGAIALRLLGLLVTTTALLHIPLLESGSRRPSSRIST